MLSEDKEEDFETKTLYERLSENRELKRQEIEEQFRYSQYFQFTAVHFVEVAWFCCFGLS